MPYVETDKQKIFDAAYIGLKAQDFKRSLSWQGHRCLYRDGIGGKCAIGHCIPDDVYDPSMEGQGPKGIVRDHPALLNILGDDIVFLSELQMVHDSSENGVGMQKHLHDFARKYKLTVPE